MAKIYVVVIFEKNIFGNLLFSATDLTFLAT